MYVGTSNEMTPLNGNKKSLRVENIALSHANIAIMIDSLNFYFNAK